MKVSFRERIIEIEQLPWWRKDFYGWPIETIKGKRFKSFARLVCINLKKPFQTIYWWWRRRKGIGKFESFAYPLIKGVEYQKSAKEIIQLQDMPLPKGLVFYMDYKYSNRDAKDNPKDPETDTPPLTWDTSKYP